MRYTVFIQIEVETHDQPPKDVHGRLANRRGFVGEDIRIAAVAATEQAIWVGSPETYFPDWPKNGKPARVIGYKQYTRRSD